MKKVEHKQDGFIEVKDTEMKWTPEQCTKKVSTRTYGEIEFAEDPSTRKPVSHFPFVSSSILIHV